MICLKSEYQNFEFILSDSLNILVTLNLKTILISLLPFLIGTGIWINDGARIAFWLTSIEERKEVPIIEGMPELGTQTQIVWRDQFVSGVETPLAGFFLSSGFIIFFFFRKQRRPN
jgi:hypothetical protein